MCPQAFTRGAAQTDCQLQPPRDTITSIRKCHQNIWEPVGGPVRIGAHCQVSPGHLFFAPGGYAFHGTYWHNNYGIQMSRGCVNMRNEDAKWLFRWLEPVTVSAKVEQTGYGTQVFVY
ncbi:MAG: hypothetical protein DWQ07_18150 [Chloroflexi bacterium]|nr:MAG: hypothetical protein DWQ07_18150 [Chloroflexota bacterium]